MNTYSITISGQGTEEDIQQALKTLLDGDFFHTPELEIYRLGYVTMDNTLSVSIAKL